ncbi:hypothetical protein Harman_00070 [Haloarcula mannanilytica]|uniref:Type IV secretion system protein TrbL n=1 Tax=Haloarcula mannanilytica TaxID=2509225 RepID=A0A4C2ECM9_9EURY|nr:type IV secretion system protein [Haloarcula mannanilytica]GCF12072.1 hypothetical protein Harman_00070 [Haloarcula mannanilytica]
MQSLGDVLVDSFERFLEKLAESVFEFVGDNVEALIDLIVTTPRPDAVFSAPTNGGWPSLYTYYWETMVPLSLLLWGLSLGVVIFLESTSHLFSGYHRTKLKKRAFAGLLGILSWWWLAAISLRFVDGLVEFLVPSLDSIGLFETVSFGAMGVAGITLAASLDLAIFLVLALIYLVRQMALYLYVLLMPLVIVFWIPSVGPFAPVERLMSRLAGFYVPFLFMAVPVAVLFRLGEVLGESVTLSIGGFGQWLLAIVAPLIAVIVPFVLFWQAGALFFMADRAAQHSSRHHMRDRKETVENTGQRGRLSVKNLRRGLAGQSAIRASGQEVLGSGSSKAHAVGRKASRTRRTIRSRLDTSTTDSSGPGEGPDHVPSAESRDNTNQDDDDTQANSNETESTDSEPSDERESDAESNESEDADSDSDDDPPRYIY